MGAYPRCCPLEAATLTWTSGSLMARGTSSIWKTKIRLGAPVEHWVVLYWNLGLSPVPKRRVPSAHSIPPNRTYGKDELLDTRARSPIEDPISSQECGSAGSRLAFLSSRRDGPLQYQL